MGIFNEHISTTQTNSRTVIQHGSRGPPGVGFVLTPSGNYDIENKKLTNVKNAKNLQDSVTLHQLNDKTVLLDNAKPGNVVHNKTASLQEPTC